MRLMIGTVLKRDLYLLKNQKMENSQSEVRKW